MRHIILVLFLSGTLNHLVAQTELQADLTSAPNANREIVFKSNAAALKSKLRPISASNKKVPQPFIKHFWEFDDGTFSLIDEENHAFNSNSNRVVQLTMTPCYTVDKIKPVSKTVQTSKSLSTPKSVNDPSFGGALRLTSNLTLHGIKAVRANDQFLGIVSFRNLIGDNRNAKLYLFYNKKDQVKAAGKILNIKDARLHGATDGVWAQEGAGVNDIKKGFYDAKVFKINGLNKLSRNVFLTFGVDRKTGFENIKELDITAALVYDGTSQVERSTLTFEISTSFDPNNMKAPRVLSFRGIDNKSFKYRVNFENMGNGPAFEVNVKSFVPEALDANTIKNISSSHAFQSTSPKDSAMKYTISPDGKTISFDFKNIVLNGTGEAWNPKKKETQGFVEYELEAKKDIRKRSLESKALIVFDNNEPIPTDPIKTEFRTGFSIGIKGGVNYQPNTEGYNYFVGATYSAYRPAGIYNQIEVMADLNKRAVMRDSFTNSFLQLPITRADSLANTIKKDSFSFIEKYKTVNSIRVVPLNLRYDFPKFASISLGIYADMTFIREQSFSTATSIKTVLISNSTTGLRAQDRCLYSRKPTSKKSSTEIDYGLFGDISLGKYSNGLALGLRFMQPLNKEKQTAELLRVSQNKLQKGFFQLYLSYKIL